MKEIFISKKLESDYMAGFYLALLQQEYCNGAIVAHPVTDGGLYTFKVKTSSKSKRVRL